MLQGFGYSFLKLDFFVSSSFCTFYARTFVITHLSVVSSMQGAEPGTQNCLEQAKPFPFWAYWRLIPNQYFSNGNSSRIWIIMVHDLNQKHQKHSIFIRKSTHWQQASFSNISLAINLKKVFYLSICPSIHLFIYPTIQQTFMEGLLYVVHCVRC